MNEDTRGGGSEAITNVGDQPKKRERELFSNQGEEKERDKSWMNRNK